MVDNRKNYPNYTVVDYKLINSILGLNIKKYLINEKIKNTKENEEYLNNLKNNVEKKYENFTQSLTKYKNKQNLNKNNKEYKEKILSFSKILTQKYNKTFNRYIKQNKRFSFLDKVKKSIKIQSVFRSYIFRIKFFKSMIEKLKNQCIKSIIKIQSFIRQKLSLKHAKIEMINYIILKNYKEKEKKLENVFNTFYNIVKFKDYFLTYDLIKRRYESAKKIQSIFRGNQVNKKVQNIIKKMKTLYTITYPFMLMK